MKAEYIEKALDQPAAIKYHEEGVDDGW